MDVPESFPRDPWPAALSGAQPKLALQQVDGKYVAGVSAEEREARYVMCADLVEQLVAYCRRKQAERPEKPLETLLEQVDAAVRTKGWDTSPIELTWCMSQVRERLL
jgi:5'-deoxynucleotidase YfbR-like HD superfamily hydrolase